MKQCPFCKKELPDEAVFCPYCMQRFGEVNQISPAPVRENAKKVLWPLAACIAVILLGLLTWWIIGQNRPAEDKSTLSSDDAANDTTDYSGYVGAWVSKEIINENQNDGGTTLEIITVKNGVIRFNLTHISDEPYNRIARLENVTAEIVDGIATFSFQNDGWQNGGTGKLEFSSGKIHVQTTVLQENKYAMWSIEVDADLTRQGESVENTDTSMNLDSFLLKKFDDVRNDLGEETQPAVFNEFDSSYRHFFGDIEVYVDPDDGSIISFYVYYNRTDDKSRYTFGAIDGNSTLEDVIKTMGQPVVDSLNTNGEIGYGMKDGFVKFVFDENMKIDYFFGFIPDDPG